MPNKQGVRSRIGLGAALAIAVAAVLFWSLTICDPFGSQPRVSESIEEAKEKGVFIAEYLPAEDPYLFGDSIRFSVREAWLEKRWSQSGKLFAEVHEGFGYQLAMVIDDAELAGYGDDWQIGVDSKWYLDRSYRGLYKRELEEPTGDRVEWPVQQGSWFTDSARRKIIGRFLLMRRK